MLVGLNTCRCGVWLFIISCIPFLESTPRHHLLCSVLWEVAWYRCTSVHRAIYSLVELMGRSKFACYHIATVKRDQWPHHGSYPQDTDNEWEWMTRWWLPPTSLLLLPVLWCCTSYMIQPDFSKFCWLSERRAKKSCDLLAVLTHHTSCYGGMFTIDLNVELNGIF